jgi:hypothetical protein
VKHRPTVIKAVAKLLDEDAESAEDMAQRVLDLVAAMNADREQWMVAYAPPRGSGLRPEAFGPYSTALQASKAAAAVGEPVSGGRVGAIRISPGSKLEGLAG